MGQITSSKITNDEKVIFTVCTDHEESLQLQGHTNDIHLFSEGVIDIKTNISLRGQYGSTKYFLIPRKLRSNIKLNGDISCQKIETKDKLIFVYIMDKLSL